MKVEIWSDIMCPFCYIGKRNFEHALEKFDDKEKIEIQWRSFELSPEMKTDPSKNTYEYLAEKKGWTLDYTKKVHDQLTERAREAGLEYNFDSVVPANSFNAHRLSHLAAKHQLQNEMEERLFAAHFTEGKNIDDEETLVQIGTETGLPEDEIREMLQGNEFSEEVEKDKYAAHQVGVQGVPFFVFDNKYAVSGAQPSEMFLDTLKKAYREFNEGNKLETSNDAESCSIDGNC
jgi:predicted DsbA family dithiol-disulfide isomerase